MLEVGTVTGKRVVDETPGRLSLRQSAPVAGLEDECASPSVTMSGRGRLDLEHRRRSDEMAHFVGLDVLVKETSVCVVDDAGKVILEQKVPTELADIIALLTSFGATYGRIGIEAGPLSQWLVNAESWRHPWSGIAGGWWTPSVVSCVGQ
jgi:hypothetical protein